MWLFWIWGTAAAMWMLLAGGPALIGVGEMGGDANIVFTLAALTGVPAWLALIALTVTRWKIQSRRKSLIQNAPALVAAALCIALQWRSFA